MIEQSRRDTPELVRSRLREWRTRHGWRQEDVADLWGRSIAFVSLVESGKRRVRPGDRIRFARALGARVRDVFDPAEP